METYDFGIVRDKFDTLTEAMSNKLEREWSGAPSDSIQVRGP